MLNMLQISGGTICKMGHVVLWPPAWLQDINSGDIAELPPEDPPTQAKRDRKGTPSYTFRPSVDVWILHLGCFDFSVAIFLFLLNAAKTGKKIVTNQNDQN